MALHCDVQMAQSNNASWGSNLMMGMYHTCLRQALCTKCTLIANIRVCQRRLQFNKADYASSMSQLLAADWDEVVHRLQNTHKRMARWVGVFWQRPQHPCPGSQDSSSTPAFSVCLSVCYATDLSGIKMLLWQGSSRCCLA